MSSARFYQRSVPLFYRLIPLSGRGGIVGLLLVAAAALVAFLWYRRKARRKGGFMPPNVPGPPWAARAAEAAVLLAAGGVMLALWATDIQMGGRLLMLDELPPQFACVNVIAFGCAAAVAMAAVAVALFWRTWAGVLVMAAALCGYQCAGGPTLGRFVGAEAMRPTARYIINLSDGVRGADI